jgi:hypothetical protein
MAFVRILPVTAAGAVVHFQHTSHIHTSLEMTNEASLNDKVSQGKDKKTQYKDFFIYSFGEPC